MFRVTGLGRRGVFRLIRANAQRLGRAHVERQQTNDDGEDPANHESKLSEAKRGKVKVSSATVLVHELDQLVVHLFRLLGRSTNGVAGAVLEMVAHELASDTAKGLVN